MQATIGQSPKSVRCGPARPQHAFLLKRVITLFGAVALSLSIAAPALASGKENNARPRIGLVLGGGGAKGFAHIGALRVLEEHRVPVDAVAGTSMGAIVGSLYASGKTADEIEDIARSIDWLTVFDDRTDRARINFRRKQDDFDFLTDFKFSFQDGELVLPEGLIQGQKLFLEIAEELAITRTITDYDNLPIPFRAVAADLETGDPVVMADGDLATAVFASMAIPGVIPPVERNGRILVDGGIAKNLPVDVAKSMGVDIVIAIDLSEDLRTRDEIDNFLDVLGQMATLLTSENTARQLELIEESDILVRPALEDIPAGDFTRATNAIEPGVTAMREQAARLQLLSLGPDEWRDHLAERKAKQGETPVLQFVRVEQDSPLSDEVVQNFINITPGNRLDSEELNANIEDLYGLDTFERITYGVVNENGRNGLVVNAKENEGQQDYFRFGLLLESDFESDANFLLAASYTKRNVNRFGGEWRTIAQIGSDLALATEFYQPFGGRLNFFANPTAVVARGNTLIFADSRRPVAEIRVSAAEIGLDTGVQLGRWGEFRVGTRRAWGKIRPNIGDLGFDKATFDDNYQLARLDIDTLDRLSFPRRGTFLRAQWTHHNELLGGDFSYQEFEWNGLTARSFGPNTFIVGGKFQSSFNAEEGSLAGFSLGGFRNLSGFSPDQLSDRHAVFGQIVYYRRLTQRSLFFDFPLYAGASIEAGNVFRELDDISVGRMIPAASVYIGADTALGPVFLGTGLAEGGNAAAYLFVGQSF